MTVLRRCLLPLLGALWVQAGWASDIRVSGFGSFIGGESDRGGGYTQDYSPGQLSFEPDSFLGLQVDSPLNPKASVVVQWLSTGDRQWLTGTEWAYVKYQVTPAFSWKVGRISVPLFLYSDYINVGYSLPWISPPGDVYNIPMTSIDGISLLRTGSVGSVDWQWEAYGGGARFNPHYGLMRGQQLETTHHVGAALEVSWQAWKARVSAHQARASLLATSGDQWPLVDALASQLRAAGEVEAANAVSMQDDRIRFLEAALAYDDGRWLATWEIKQLQAFDQAPLPYDVASYVMVGRRMGEVLLDLTYSQAHDKAPALARSLSPDSPLVEAVDALTDLVAPTNHTWIIGTRWDMAPNLAIKAEYQRVSDFGFDPRYVQDGGGYQQWKMGVQVIF